MINLIGAIVSGSFAVIAAYVPYYLQSRKARELVNREIREERYYHYSFWHLMFGVSLPLACYFLIGAVTVFYTLSGMFMAAAQTTNTLSFLEAFDISKCADIVQVAGIMEMFFIVPVMFVVVLLTSKFIYHRFTSRASLFIAMCAVFVWVADIVLSLIFQSPAIPIKDIVRNAIVNATSYSVATVTGAIWAKKTHDLFLLKCIFSRLASADRTTFLELAKDLSYGLNDKKQYQEPV